MADFGDLEEVEAELARLAEGGDPLVGRLPRRPGQKEERWAEALSAARPESAETTEITRVPDHVDRSSVNDEVAALRADVDTLRHEVSTLTDAVTDLRTALGL